jgi:hypothetical protein
MSTKQMKGRPSLHLSEWITYFLSERSSILITWSKMKMIKILIALLKRDQFSLF